MVVMLDRAGGRWPRWGRIRHERRWGSTLRSRLGSGEEAQRLRHARLLAEQVSRHGTPIPPRQALEALAFGRLVNFSTRPATHPKTGASPAAAAATDASRAPDRRAAAVWGIDLQAWEIVLGGTRGAHLPDRLVAGQPVGLDYTAGGDTFALSGAIARVHYGIESRMVVTIHHALVFRHRRFFRVAVDITPSQLSLVAPRSARPVFGPPAIPQRPPQIEGRIVDLSVGGLGLLTREPLASGTVVDLQFSLPADQGSLCARGQVVPAPGPAERLDSSGMRGAGTTADGVYRCGMLFQPLLSHDLDRLQHALRLQERALRSEGERGEVPAENAAAHPPFFPAALPPAMSPSMTTA